jgi:hypothetical protein
VTDDAGLSATATTSITVQDSKRPLPFATLNRISLIPPFNQRDFHDKGDDRAVFELFKVEFHCSDRCDPAPGSTADLNGITVKNRQVVALRHSDGVEQFMRKNILFLKAPQFKLVVRCTDKAGNTAEIAVSPHLNRDRDKKKGRRY